jgi:hypothetical protein
MSKKFSWSGSLVVMACLACMLYYYLVFRYSVETQARHHPVIIDN